MTEKQTPLITSKWIEAVDAELIRQTGQSPGGGIIAKLIGIVLATQPSSAALNEKPDTVAGQCWRCGRIGGHEPYCTPQHTPEGTTA